MNKVPKLRFRGFEGEWEEKKLGDICSFTKGKGYSKSDISEKGFPLFLYGRMYTNYSFSVSSVDTYASLKEDSYISEGNEVVIPASGETAQDIVRASAVSASGIVLGGDLNILKFDLVKYSTPFIALSFSNGKLYDQLVKSAQGKTVVHLQNSEIQKGKILIPSLPEQRRIASYFTHLDTLIEASRQKVEKYKQVKAASLQALFPQNGERTPKLRFKGCEGEWKTVELGEIGIFSKGHGYSKADIMDKGIPLFLYGRLYTNYSFITTSVDTFTNKRDGAVISEGNEIVIPASGETAEDIARASAILSEGIILGGDLNIIRIDTNLYDSAFIALSISHGSTHYELSKSAQGKTVVHLHNSEIKKGRVNVPSLSEQHLIAQYFTHLDSLLSLEQQRYEKLQQVKRASLSQMFV